MSLFALLGEILFIGHSLVGPNLPGLLEAGLMQQGDPEAQVEAQIINGATLAYQWDNSADAEGTDGRARLATGEVDTLILTEAIPLDGHMKWSDSAGQVARWSELAWSANPQTQVLVYETWHSLKSGTEGGVEGDPGGATPWAERIEADLPDWQALVAAAEAKRPAEAPPVRLVPAGQAMARAAEAAEAGQLPGVGNIQDLFSDDIHPNGKGLYLIAMVHLAVISGSSPEGLPAKLERQWIDRASVISPELATAMQRIAWEVVQDSTTPEVATSEGDASNAGAAPASEPEPAADVAVAPEEPAAVETGINADAGEPATATEPAATAAPAQAHPHPVAEPPAGLTPITNPSLGFGLAGINDWSVQQPFLDVMKTARPWVGHLTGQWGGMDHAALADGGWLNRNGWPIALPPEVTGISTLVLTDLPTDAAGVAGRYLVRWQGQGDLTLDGRAENVTTLPDGGLSFDYTPGEGAVILTITRTEPADPLRAISIVRADRADDWAKGALFNPDWLNRLRGARLIRFMDWMNTNDATIATVEQSPKPGDYTWARVGVPIEVMVALANELDADPWFTLSHLSQDSLVRFYAETVLDLLEADRKVYVEYSNEVWNPQFEQARWADAQARARWGDEASGLEFYGFRAAEVGAIWTDVFADGADSRLIRVLATQTGALGIERAILDAPSAVAAGLPAPKTRFDAYAVTGYFAALLGGEIKQDMVRQWLAESKAADPEHPYALANARAAEELLDGRHSGLPEDTLDDVLGRVLPYHRDIAKAEGVQLLMYEGGSHVTGYGPLVDDAELAAFFQQLNYSPEMGDLYRRMLAGWAGLSDTPFNAFVDVYRPTKWGSWGALRHLGDENPRWRALAEGCGEC